MVVGISDRAIAGQYGLSKSSVARHREHIRQAIEQAEGDISSRLVAKIQELASDAQRIKRDAMKSGDLRTALSAIHELTRIIELQAKMAGELKNETNVNVNGANLLQNPEWIRIRDTLVRAVVQCDACRERVALALMALKK